MRTWFSYVCKSYAYGELRYSFRSITNKQVVPMLFWATKHASITKMLVSC